MKLGSKYRDLRIFRESSKKVSRDTAELYLLERYYFLITKTSYLREEAFEFLVEGKTYKDIVKDYNISEGYLKNIIHREIREVYDDITEDPFALVRYKDYIEDVEYKRQRVQELTKRINFLIDNQKMILSQDIDEYMLVDLSDYADPYREYDGDIDGELLVEMVQRLRYISKPYLSKLFEGIDKRTLGYIVYILNTKENDLSDRDKENRQAVKDTWFIP